MLLSKKEQKRLYDIEYRKKNKELIKKKKQEFCETEAGRAMQKRNRDKMRYRHLEYCRTEKYKEYKKNYDKKRRAKIYYGEFAECVIACIDIKNLVIKKIPDAYERRKMRGTIDRMIRRRNIKRQSKIRNEN